VLSFFKSCLSFICLVSDHMIDHGVARGGWQCDDNIYLEV